MTSSKPKKTSRVRKTTKNSKKNKIKGENVVVISGKEIKEFDSENIDRLIKINLKKFSTKELTFDHLIPRSKGGLTNWENVVTACSKCNWTKGSRDLSQVGFKLLRKPKEPSQYSLRLKSKNFPSDYLHSSWRDYLYWDSVLEKD